FQCRALDRARRPLRGQGYQSPLVRLARSNTRGDARSGSPTRGLDRATAPVRLARPLGSGLPLHAVERDVGTPGAGVIGQVRRPRTRVRVRALAVDDQL